MRETVCGRGKREGTQTLALAPLVLVAVGLGLGAERAAVGAEGREGRGAREREVVAVAPDAVGLLGAVRAAHKVAALDAVLPADCACTRAQHHGNKNQREVTQR